MSPRDVLQLARGRLIVYGWTKPSQQSPRGDKRRCIVQTIEEAVPDEAWYSKEAPQRQAMAALRHVVGHPRLVDWNDKQTSIEPVLNAVEATIQFLSGDDL